jgi:hypothetical protein
MRPNEFIETPAGSPISENVIGIVPVAVTWNVPPVPLTTVLLSSEVISGATGAAVTVNVTLNDSDIPLSPLTVTFALYVPTERPEYGTMVKVSLPPTPRDTVVLFRMKDDA